MAYLYKHTKKDTNDLFYFGVGGLNEFDNYTRAYALRSRNDLWVNIVNKHGFNVEIIIENSNPKEVLCKEIELIALHGRIDLGTGILANMTDGGDGLYGFSKTTIEKRSAKLRGKKREQWIVDKIKRVRKMKREHFLLTREKLIYVSPKERKQSITRKIRSDKGRKQTPEHIEKVKIACKNVKHFCTEEHKLKLSLLKKGVPRKPEEIAKMGTNVIDITTGIIFNTCKEAAITYNLKVTTLCQRLNKNSKLLNNTNLRYLHEQ